MTITKADYLSFKQCSKSYWIQKKQPNHMKQTVSQSTIDKNKEVKEIAKDYFPKGYSVPKNGDLQESIRYTESLIRKQTSVIYDAVFQYEESYVICDVLYQNENGWNIYKISSSTSSKERHVDDLAYQYCIVSQSLPVQGVKLLHLNKDYVRQGELDVSKLFIEVDATNASVDRFGSVMFEIEDMKDLLKQSNVEKNIGVYCNKYGKDDSPCGAKSHCWSHIPAYSVFNLSRIGKKAFELYEKGITSLDAIPSDYKLNASQVVQVQTFLNQETIIDSKQIQNFLTTFTFPLYFLDFETFQQAIPKYDGIKPYQQVPFQYSLHVLPEREGELEHKEFLAKEGQDERRVLAERLVRDIPKGVCTVAYNMSFEKMVLKELSNQYPDLADHLMDIHDNMVDLMVPFQKKWYYMNEMRGSYSIKYVLPALFPNEESLDYKVLPIQNGSMAMEIYEVLHTYPKQKIEEIRKALLAYCHLDTLAMVKIWEFLMEIN